jgi:hypothetical protein
MNSRREFLSFVAASPLATMLRGQDEITSAKDAINVMDFEAIAR